MTDPNEPTDDDLDRSLAIAHVFVDLFSAVDLTEDSDDQIEGTHATLILKRLRELEAVDVEDRAVDITPLVTGAALAMSDLLDVLVAKTGLTQDEAVVAWRDELG